jgi:WD40 repeat protein
MTTDATMTTENARTPSSLALARRILAVGLFAGVLALLATPPGASAQTTERVSVDSAGNEANGESRFRPAISADGRFVAFTSRASNLVPGNTNGYDQVFVHDRRTGVTELVSVDSAGDQANSTSFDPAISADGRVVAFESYATNLVPGGSNQLRDVFVHDRQTGTTERVNVNSAGTQGNGVSFGASLSADGRFVAFTSIATNLVAWDTNGYPDVFVLDRWTGTTERVSVDSTGNEANGGGFNASISADGRFVAFVSRATNLVPGDTNAEPGAFVHDRQTRTTERVSVDSAGNQRATAVEAPAISTDGRFVAFLSGGVFVHDRSTGTSEVVSYPIPPNSFGPRWPALSADGRFVAFWITRVDDVLVYDRQTGTTEQVRGDRVGTRDRDGAWTSGARFGLSMSADGRFVAFVSYDPNLVPGDTNGTSDVFVHDRGTLDQDTTPPLRTNGQPSGTLPAGTTQTTLSLVTNENATCRYSTTPGVAYEAMTATFATTGGTAHATAAGGLSDGGNYSFSVRCQDALGNANADDFIIDFSVATSVTTTTVNFDSPAPPGGPGSLDGVFAGIDFGIGQWAWSGPYNVDPTNNVYFANSTGTSRTFAFSPAPRVLQSLRVYGTRAGTMTLSDDAGQTLSQDVATGSMQLVSTGWTRPSTTVTVSFTMGWSLGVDDITYTTAP